MRVAEDAIFNRLRLLMLLPTLLWMVFYENLPHAKIYAIYMRIILRDKELTTNISTGKKVNFNSCKCEHIIKKYRLSRRESQCLDLILQSKIAKQISKELGLSQRTVERYIETLKSKLDCRTKTDVVIKVLTSSPAYSDETVQ
jgi:DNA-binding CsgD family transcriptional regulator